ncbi:MAG: GIY-YIG nuclease family protein [Hyphomicrobiales bacterium]|nr:GIY-YIG nuclease family protein [Hyphomicrobiales bacterium]
MRRRRNSGKSQNSGQTAGLWGWIYVVTNPEISGKVKIGFSTKDPSRRVKEFNSEAIPANYKLEYDVHVEDPHSVEQNIHSILKNSRPGLHDKKEWFWLSPSEAIELVRRIIGTKFKYERPERPTSWKNTSRSDHTSPNQHSASHDRQRTNSAKSNSTNRAKVIVQCFGCLQALRIPADRSGTVKCPKCQHMNKVTSWLNPSKTI